MIENSFAKGLRKEGKIKLKNWFLATRPETLTIGIVPIFVGTAFAYLELESLNWLLLLANTLCVICIQIGMNLINDALDIQKGGQFLKNSELERAGLLTVRQFLWGGYGFFALSFLFGIPLMVAGGWPFAVLVPLSIACGYFYTGGPFPIAYTGLGEVFLLIFYGWADTIAPFYLQAGRWENSLFLAGTQLGCLAIVTLAINNLQDHVADAIVKKKTLAVRLGPSFARWEVALAAFFPFALGIFWAMMGKIEMALLPFLALPFVMNDVFAIWKADPSKGYHQYLARSALYHLMFGCLLIIPLL